MGKLALQKNNYAGCSNLIKDHRWAARFLPRSNWVGQVQGSENLTELREVLLEGGLVDEEVRIVKIDDRFAQQHLENDWQRKWIN